MPKKVKFSFLTAGPRFGLALPDDFDALPDLSSPLTIKDGSGARSFDFVARARDKGVEEPNRLLRRLTSRGGHTVELYERLEEPQQWYLRWLLASGVLYTHLRGEDGVERADGVVASLGISENGGAPFLLPEGPLGRGVSTRPGYQELAVFRSSRAGWAIELQRPGFMAKGKIVQYPEGNQAILRAGASHGIEVIVHAATDAEAGRRAIVGVVDSLRPE
jgi:hypothetical protein